MQRSPVWHPFTQHGLQDPITNVERASGALLHTADGRTIIDGISSWWVTTHGHCHPRITAAIASQAAQLDQIIFAGHTHEPAERVAKQLREIMPRELTHVFFSDSGSTSVEVALKMALGFWRNRGEARHRIIAMEHGYHGDTVGTMSVGHRGVFNQRYEPLLFEVARVPFPEPGQEQAVLDALERHCRDPHTAAFIVEPLICGAGGMRLYSAGVLHEMRRMCAEHCTLFIADEVMTGWGRTGTLLACEQADMVPDLLCLSKGLTGGSLPLAVTLATDRIFDAHWSLDRARMLFHSSSYTANPIACAAASANLDIWREEPVLQRVQALQRLAAGVLKCLEQLPNVLGARQLGTIIALEVRAPEEGYLSSVGPAMMRHFCSSDVLLRPLGSTLYLMPPYCIDQKELDRLVAVAAEAIHVATSSQAA